MSSPTRTSVSDPVLFTYIANAGCSASCFIYSADTNRSTGAQATDGGAGCCETGIDQPILISDDSQFKTANIKT